ncbi:TonB-dependent receptor [Sphingomonas sp. DT-204]|uniref:TonB-dependent receptor n=1 Tax=Sphingomonas sp. DT-204 TaxID=3396166 RepID=UPI003F1CD957
MTKLNSSTMTRLALGASALAMALAAAPSFAQSADTVVPDTQVPDQPDQQDIVITGFRAALESAVAEKKNRDQVVESISAEDIGKLPDASIAESIARLPGLTSQRVSGRSNVISIRGFAPDFSTTLLNGREQTSTGDNRAVEYDQYPSEVISQVNVYKTPMASLVGQGLSGTVDLRTIRPLDYGKRVISVGARGIYSDLGKLNAGSKEFGYRVNGTYVDKFAGDTIGVALSASYVDEPYQIQEFNSWGYADSPAGPVIGGSKSYNTSTTLKRLGLQGTVQWRPAPEFTTTFDAFYSDFKDDQIKRGVELPLLWGGVPLTNAQATDGLVTSGTYTGVKGVVRNDAFQRHAKLYSFGWNGKYEGDDGWKATFDVSHSRTDRNELTLETYAGTGRVGSGATDTINFRSSGSGTTFDHVLDYGDWNTILLTSPQGWGGTLIGLNGDAIRGGQDGYYNNRVIKDRLWQYRAEVEKEIDNGFLRSIQFGLNYTQRSKSLTPEEAFVGLVANTDGTVSVPVPEEFRLGTTNLSYLGLGPVISYDPVALLNSGVYHLIANPYGDVVVKGYDVSEKVMTAYLQANIRSHIGSAELTGNAGVQFAATSQHSNGASAIFAGYNPNGSPNILGIPRHEGATFDDWLPSLNLSLRFPSDFVIRFGAAREIIRPKLDDMKASTSYGFNMGAGGDPSVARVDGSSGNPVLRPWRAWAVDLTFEKYFGTRGYLAAQFFWKNLESYVYNATIPFDFTGYPVGDPGTYMGADGVIRPRTINYNGFMTVPINGKGGKLYGVELAGTLPLGGVVGALDGFGLTGGGSYTITKIHPRPGDPTDNLPGYSKWVVNGTAFFEKWGFSARGSVRYRSTFIGDVSAFGATPVRRRAAPETIVDAQIGYDFSDGAFKGLSLYLQGQNLTDEPFKTYNPDHPEQVIDYQTYGRRFLAGFTYKF